MKRLSFILGVLLIVGLLGAQSKVEVAKNSAPPTGPKTAANSDAIVCPTDTGCVIKAAAGNIADGADVTLGAKADNKSTATDATAITAMQVLKEISFMLQNPTYIGTFASGGTAAMTGTTSTSVIGGTASNYVYISGCRVSNSSLTVSTDVLLQDGSGGTTIDTIPAPAGTTATTGTSGAVISYGDHPLKVPTTGNGLFAANVTTGSSIKIFCNGFKSTTSF